MVGSVWAIIYSNFADRKRAIVTRRKANGRSGEDITILIKMPVADKIRRIHRASQVGERLGDKTSLEKFCVEIIENFIADNRKGVLL